MNIKLNLPAAPFSGQLVTFTAPCDCTNVTDGLSINGEIYTVCDALDECVTGVGGAWIKGAQVSVVLDCDKKKAYIQNNRNYATPNHTHTAEEVGAAPSSHNHSASNITSGTLGVARGGTGAATHTSNAVLTGNGTSAVKNVATASGAFFATSANGAPKFGTLPVAQGGTGVTTAAAIGLKAYPVGSIYMSVNSTSPASLFGGTWAQLKDRFLLGAGSTYTNGNTGGSATHTLTIAEMPTHRHNISHYASVVAAGSDKTVWSLNAENERTSTAYDTGGGGAHNNMPPYLVVYMWKRTA